MQSVALQTKAGARKVFIFATSTQTLGLMQKKEKVHSTEMDQHGFNLLKVSLLSLEKDSAAGGDDV